MLVGRVVRGVAGGVGLASESVHAYKEKKQNQKARQLSGESVEQVPKNGEEAEIEVDDQEPVPPTIIEDDEEHWELDEAQAEIQNVESSPASSQRKRHEKDVQDLAEYFLKTYPAPPPAYTEVAQSSSTAVASSSSAAAAAAAAADEEHEAEESAAPFSAPVVTGRIPLPVLIPQRRPHSRSRGFIRAYAPVLENCGIDQAMWLHFLDTFEKSSQASPWINALNLAGIATCFMPTGIGIAVGIAIQITTQIAMEIHGRTKTNAFLNKINQSFFRPRGLYCVVLTWKPESSENYTEVNLTSMLSSTYNKSSHHQNLGQRMANSVRSSNGKTYGDLDFLEIAPLVFPELDKLADKDSPEAKSKKEQLKGAKTFVAGYMDRRATARYAINNPSSLLTKTTPKAEFTSRYADPSHPASSGNLVSLLTGGKVNPPPIGPLALLGGRKEDIQARNSRGLGGFIGQNRGYGHAGYGHHGRRRQGGLGMLVQGIAEMSSNSNRAGSSPPAPYGGPPAPYGGSSSSNQVSPPAPYGGSSSSTEDRQLQQREQDLARREAALAGREAMTGGQGGYGRRNQGYGLGGGGVGGGGRPIGRGGRGGGGDVVVKGVKKLLKQDVLYLMVVNMPTEEEMAHAQETLNGMSQMQR